MQIHIYNPYTNLTVTQEYISTVEAAFKNAGYNTEFVAELKKQSKNCTTAAFVIAAKDAIAAKRKGYRKVYFWVQGIIPEESYVRHKSKLRFAILSMIERRGLKCADFVYYVSHAMKEHFRKKYNYENNNCYIMPCFNAEIDKSVFLAEEKYKDNVFLYAGSLDAWQCFEQTVALYKKLEEEIPNASLRVLTQEKAEAERIIKKYRVLSYSVDFKPSSEIKEEMAKAKFGFSLRQDHPVNVVATPTKLSTYIANGVIPIYSKYISDFHALAKDMRFAVCAENGENGNIEKIKKLCREQQAKEVLSEFNEVFGKYYSKEYHISRIAEMMSRLK